MKLLDQSLSFSAILFAGLVAFCSADAFTEAGGGSLRFSFPRIESFFFGDDDFTTNSKLFKGVDDTFREFRREVNDPKKKWKGRKVMYFGNKDGETGESNDAMKKWIEKSFDLASELNNDLSSSSTRDSTEKVLRKVRKGAELMYNDFDDEVFKVDSAATTAAKSSEEETSNENDQSEENNKPKVITVNPYAEYTGDDETFRVAVDLPGVEKDSIEVTVEDDSGLLVVEASRSSLGNKKERKYLKKIDFGFDEVDAEQMEASYDNGVLIVSAPKKKEEEKPETKRRIPIA